MFDYKNIYKQSLINASDDGNVMVIHSSNTKSKNHNPTIDVAMNTLERDTHIQ